MSTEPLCRTHQKYISKVEKQLRASKAPDIFHLSLAILDCEKSKHFNQHAVQNRISKWHFVYLQNIIWLPQTILRTHISSACDISFVTWWLSKSFISSTQSRKMFSFMIFRAGKVNMLRLFWLLHFTLRFLHSLSIYHVFCCIFKNIFSEFCTEKVVGSVWNKDNEIEPDRKPQKMVFILQNCSCSPRLCLSFLFKVECHAYNYIRHEWQCKRFAVRKDEVFRTSPGLISSFCFIWLSWHTKILTTNQNTLALPYYGFHGTI